MSLSHLFAQPVVQPRPTRVVRGVMGAPDVEPPRAPGMVYIATIKVHTPEEPRRAMTREERLAKRRAHGAAYRARQKAAGKAKPRKPYSEYTPEQKAKRRAKQLEYYYANRAKINDRERQRYHSMTPEEKRAHNQRSQEWRKANPERVRELRKAKRAEKRAAKKGAANAA